MTANDRSTTHSCVWCGCRAISRMFDLDHRCVGCVNVTCALVADRDNMAVLNTLVSGAANGSKLQWRVEGEIRRVLSYLLPYNHHALLQRTSRPAVVQHMLQCAVNAHVAGKAATRLATATNGALITDGVQVHRVTPLTNIEESAVATLAMLQRSQAVGLAPPRLQVKFELKVKFNDQVRSPK